MSKWLQFWSLFSQRQFWNSCVNKAVFKIIKKNITVNINSTFALVFTRKIYKNTDHDKHRIFTFSSRLCFFITLLTVYDDWYLNAYAHVMCMIAVCYLLTCTDYFLTSSDTILFQWLSVNIKVWRLGGWNLFAHELRTKEAVFL